MFDIGALELVVIAVVALIVVGPERLPRLARTAGRWVGRARRALLSVKDEIDREIKAEELREILRRQNERKPLDEILEEEFAPKKPAAQHPPQHPPQGDSGA
jgi:sec-independent protein translocase protein TatB